MPFLDELAPNKKNIVQKLPYDNTIMEDISLDTDTTGVVSNKDVIGQSITNILLTMQGERLFNLSFGTNIYSYLFASVPDLSPMRADVRRSILNFEQRITIDENDILLKINQDEHYIDLQITYRIKVTSEWGMWKDRLFL
jgi:phage baseplate assembly protein W